MSRQGLSRSASDTRWLFDRGRGILQHSHNNNHTHNNSPTEQSHTLHEPQLTNNITNTRSLFQQTLHYNILEFNDNKVFGDRLSTKNNKFIRIGSNNVGNLPDKLGKTKSKCFFDYIKNREFDVMLNQEVGLNWRKIKEQDTWYERLFHSYGKEFRCCAYNNSTEPELTGKYQPGGTAVTITKAIAHKMINKGGDKLGRWPWMKLQGTNNSTVVFISIYVPVTSHQIGSTFMQHVRYYTKKLSEVSPTLRNENNGRPKMDPDELLLKDLYVQLKKWHDEGTTIIAGIDTNYDIRKNKFREFFSNFGMDEKIT